MHIDQNILFIVIVAIIGIWRLIARIRENVLNQSQRDSRPRTAQPNRPPRPLATEEKTDEQRVREFLEALGRPTGSAPPSKVQPRTNLPPRPIAPIQPPPAMRPFSPVLVQPRSRVKKAASIPPQQWSKSSVPEPAVVVPMSSASIDINEPGMWMAQEQARSALPPDVSKAPLIKPTDETVSARPSAEIIWKPALRSLDGMRAAIVLREILGPPRGMHDFGTA
jgi:hypothetical protein